MSIASHTTLRGAVFTRSNLGTQVGLVAGGVAFLAAMAQIAIKVPGSPVPITGQTLGALLLGSAYGEALGFTTFASYLIIGLLGAPVFASGTHGFARLTSATGGYLIGMLLASYVTGWFASRQYDRKFSTSPLPMMLGEVLVFGSGLFWLHHVTGLSWSKTVSVGLTPFILGEVIKIAIASAALPTLWRALPNKERLN